MSPTTKTPKPIQEVAAEPAYLVKEIAAHLRTEQSVIYNLIRDGKLRHVRVGRLIRIPESALREYLAGQ